jgi:hypothetical protein
MPAWKLAAQIRAEIHAGRNMNEHHAEAFLIARAARTRLHAAVA